MAVRAQASGFVAVCEYEPGGQPYYFALPEAAELPPAGARIDCPAWSDIARVVCVVPTDALIGQYIRSTLLNQRYGMRPPKRRAITIAELKAAQADYLALKHRPTSVAAASLLSTQENPAMNTKTSRTEQLNANLDAAKAALKAQVKADKAAAKRAKAAAKAAQLRADRHELALAALADICGSGTRSERIAAADCLLNHLGAAA